MEMHQLRRYGALRPPQRGPNITRDQGNAAQQRRFLCHPVCYAEELPYGGTAQVVVLFSIRKQRPQWALVCGAQRSMMMETFFRKGSNFPTLHPCGHRRDPIHASRPVWDVATDLLETLAPEKLTRPGNVVFTFEAVFARIIISVLGERSSGETQVRIFGKLLHHKFHVIRFERNIGIKVSHYVELNRFNPLESESNGMSLRSKIAIGVLRSANQLDPQMALRIALDDFC